MHFFEQYSSNTVAGSGNQHFFLSKKDQICQGRVFYKISCPGQYRYSLLFSNIIDSTFADGSVSHKNLICRPWKIHRAHIARYSKGSLPENFKDPSAAAVIHSQKREFVPLTFQGRVEKEVAPGEFFHSDPVPLCFEKDDYLCLELAFSGEMIPYHEETLLPVFLKGENGWAYGKKMPFAGMIGCDRKTQGRIGFLGDSITQGIGAKENSYDHWNAVLSRKLGDEYAYWNLGLGFGRANDMASDGAWAYKAKQNDILVVCYGVNDIRQGASQDQVIADLIRVVSFLKKENKTVILQTVPPFCYKGEQITVWEKVNEYIKQTLSKKVDLLFDVVPVLQKSELEPHLTQYGDHPNEKGSMLWAQALYQAIEQSGILSCSGETFPCRED